MKAKPHRHGTGKNLLQKLFRHLHHRLQVLRGLDQLHKRGLPAPHR
jgi:hypothetical protein